MQASEFQPILEEQLARVREIMGAKRDEYADDTDVLHNFKQASHLTGATMEQALAGFMVKHTVSIYDMIEDGEMHSLAQWDEKITDHINYLILLRAIVQDRYKTWSGETSQPEGMLHFDKSLSVGVAEDVKRAFRDTSTTRL